MLASFTAHSGKVTAIARLNVRSGRPERTATVAMKVEAGTALRVLGIGTGETVSGNGTWYAGDADTYFWSGACSSFVSDLAPSSGATMRVNRRPNGTIRPLDDTAMRAVFGDFAFVSTSGGRIRITTPDWTGQNILRLATPTLEGTGYPSIEIHTKAETAFRAVFDAIEAAGLARLILTCAGTFVPRHKGWNPNRGLSSHSWGVAIDLNDRWNGYGVQPAPLGAHGSVRELVPFFEAEGFAWGGYFSPPYEDGMHFELARLDL